LIPLELMNLRRRDNRCRDNLQQLARQLIDRQGSVMTPTGRLRAGVISHPPLPRTSARAIRRRARRKDERLIDFAGFRVPFFLSIVIEVRLYLFSCR
jgi:hypothetical protein